MTDPDTLLLRAFYWLFQHEYQKIMSTKCIKCLKPELILNHSSACVYYFEVVIHDVIAQEALSLIGPNRLKKAAIDLGQFFNVDKLSDISIHELLNNVSPKELARAVNYKFSPVFTKLSKNL